MNSFRKTACTIFLILSLGLSLPSLAENPPTSLQSAFKAHCIKCHGKGRKIERKVNLLALSSGDDFDAKPELLEQLIAVLEDRQMPPEDEPVLSAVEREQMVSSLHGMLAQSVSVQ